MHIIRENSQKSVYIFAPITRVHGVVVEFGEKTKIKLIRIQATHCNQLQEQCMRDNF